jgi:hypothetical protein
LNQVVSCQIESVLPVQPLELAGFWEAPRLARGFGSGESAPKSIFHRSTSSSVPKSDRSC